MLFLAYNAFLQVTSAGSLMCQLISWRVNNEKWHHPTIQSHIHVFPINPFKAQRKKVSYFVNEDHSLDRMAEDRKTQNDRNFLVSFDPAEQLRQFLYELLTISVKKSRRSPPRVSKSKIEKCNPSVNKLLLLLIFIFMFDHLSYLKMKIIIYFVLLLRKSETCLISMCIWANILNKMSGQI
jgi:hypothetical protein